MSTHPLTPHTTAPRRSGAAAPRYASVCVIALSLLAACPVAHANAPADDASVPLALETLGDSARVREAQTGDPLTRAADATLAAGGGVAGAVPLLDAARTHTRHDEETWVADVGLLLRGTHDRDRDGFFAGFELTLDIDTTHAHRDVYAELALADSRGLVVLRHQSATFTVHGYSSADRYRIEVELLRDYPADFHDLHVDVRDARDGQLLDQVSAGQFRSLAALPLEDEEALSDGTLVTGQSDSFVTGHAAASGPLLALSLAALALWRRRASRATLSL